jgi:hypothetical protein
VPSAVAVNLTPATATKAGDAVRYAGLTWTVVPTTTSGTTRLHPTSPRPTKGAQDVYVGPNTMLEVVRPAKPRARPVSAAAVKAAPATPATPATPAPTHTDLMVAPESLDAFLASRPPAKAKRRRKARSAP